MKYGLLGTGIVGHTLGSRLVQAGHDVKMGSRDADNPKAVDWASAAGLHASAGTFAEAASYGEVVINATAGMASLEAIALAGPANIGSKVVIDVSNPLDTSKGFPPSLSVGNTTSLGEQIQAALPSARVVKTLNTMSAAVMVNPGALREAHNVFIGGDHTSGKAEARDLLRTLGWPDEDIIDLGDITSSRAVEAYLLLWTEMFQSSANLNFNIRFVKA